MTRNEGQERMARAAIEADLHALTIREAKRRGVKAYVLFNRFVRQGLKKMGVEVPAQSEN